MANTAAELKQELFDEGILPTDHTAIMVVLEMVFELEHQGMEPGAYSVTLEQYVEVAHDLIRGFDATL